MIHDDLLRTKDLTSYPNPLVPFNIYCSRLKTANILLGVSKETQGYTFSSLVCPSNIVWLRLSSRLGHAARSRLHPLDPMTAQDTQAESDTVCVFVVFKHPVRDIKVVNSKGEENFEIQNSYGGQNLSNYS